MQKPLNQDNLKLTTTHERGAKKNHDQEGSESGEEVLTVTDREL
jgi:hypothetical protein